MQPFRVVCLTCNAPLRVRDASLIGHILPCPKCNSMVEITPPENMPVEESLVENAPPDESMASAGGTRPSATPPDTLSGPVPFGEFPTVPKPAWTKWFAVGSAGALAAAALIGTIYFAMAGGDGEEPIVVASSDAENATVADPATNAADTDAASPESDVSQADPDTRQEDHSAVDSKAPVDNAPTAQTTAQTTAAEGASLADEPATPPAAVNRSETRPPQKDANKSRKVETLVAQKSVIVETEKSKTEPTERKESDESQEAAAPITNTTTTPTSALATPAKPARTPFPAADIDVTARLSIKLGDAKFQKVPLHHFVGTLSTMSAVPIRFDAATLARVGREPDDLVKIAIQDASLGDVLSDALGRWGLTYLATGPRVIVHVPPHDEAALRTVRHAVGDLASDTASLGQLAEKIRTLVAPKTWESAGGRGKIEAVSGALRIVQSMDVQFQVLMFREKIRVARGRPPKSRLDPVRFQLKTRQQLGKDMLAKTVTIRPAEGETLNTIAERLSHGTSLVIAIDEMALMEAGMSGDDEANIEVDKEPLAEALAKLLRSRNLTFRVVDHRIIEITTPTAAAVAYHVEFYPVPTLATDRDMVDRLVDRIQRQVSPESWTSNGGAGALVYDEPSRCLIVRQTASVHAELESFLQE